jgi:hypothetical protein
MQLAQLRSRLEQVIAPPPVAADALPTGIGDLDAALGGGVPRGRLTEVSGPLGAGKATLMRALISTALERGQGVACIDASRTLDPADWASLDCDFLRMVRPRDPARGAWCADVLLRSGAFTLVVLDGAPPLTRQVALRLVGLARDKDAAFVVVGDGAVSQVGGAVRMEMRRRWGGGGQRRPSELTVLRGGLRTTIEVPSVIYYPRRLHAHPEVPDRRGVAGGRQQVGQAGRTDKRWKGARNGGRIPGR